MNAWKRKTWPLHKMKSTRCHQREIHTMKSNHFFMKSQTFLYIPNDFCELKRIMWFFRIDTWIDKNLKIYQKRVGGLKTLQNSFGLKKSTNKDMTLIFSVKAEMLLFSNLTSGGHLFVNCVFDRHLNFEKNQNFQNFKLKWIVSCPPDIIFEKSNISAFTGKKLMSYHFLLL